MSIHSKSVSSINAPSGCFLLNCASILLSVHFSLFLILCFPFCFRMRLFGCWEISEEQWGFGFLSWVGFLLSLLNLEEDQTKSNFFRFLFLFFFPFIVIYDCLGRQVAILFCLVRYFSVIDFCCELLLLNSEVFLFVWYLKLTLLS